MVTHDPTQTWVLVEGASDVAAVRALRAARGITPEDEPCVLVDMGGATNIRRHLELASEQHPPPRVVGRSSTTPTHASSAVPRVSSVPVPNGWSVTGREACSTCCEGRAGQPCVASAARSIVRTPFEGGRAIVKDGSSGLLAI